MFLEVYVKSDRVTVVFVISWWEPKLLKFQIIGMVILFWTVLTCWFQKYMFNWFCVKFDRVTTVVVVFSKFRVKTQNFFQHFQHKKWLKFDHAKMPILGCLDMLATFLDESDPDVDEANLIHAYQTAEKIRENHPDKPWMHLAGEKVGIDFIFLVL